VEAGEEEEAECVGRKLLCLPHAGQLVREILPPTYEDEWTVSNADPPPTIHLVRRLTARQRSINHIALSSHPRNYPDIKLSARLWASSSKRSAITSISYHHSHLFILVGKGHVLVGNKETLFYGRYFCIIMNGDEQKMVVYSMWIRLSGHQF
jgi:hypothetical protein